MTDEMKLFRNDLLTRRIRRVLRAFANGPRGYHHGGLPNVDWDDEIIPKDLYPDEDLIATREERDIAKEQEEVMVKVRQREKRLSEESKIAKATAKRKADAERVQKRLQKAEKKRKEQEEEERQRIEEERKKKEESDRKKKEEEEEKMRKEAEKRKEEEEEEQTRKEAERRKEEEEAQRKKEVERRKEEEEAQRRKEVERRKEEEEAKKEEERKREEEETEAKEVAEMEKKEEEEAIRKQEEEARKNEEAQGEMGDSGDIGTEEEGAGEPAAMGDRKGKGKQVISDGQEPQKPKKQGKKRPRKEFKSSEIIKDSDDDLADNASIGEVSKKPRTTLDVAQSAPPPCDRCRSGNIRCYPNGYRKACAGCRSSKQTCSHSKLKSLPSGSKPPKRQARQSTSRVSVNLPPPPHVAVPPAPYSHQVIQVKRKRAQEDEGEAGPSQILKLRIPPCPGPPFLGP